MLELGLERDRMEPELQTREWGTLKMGAHSLENDGCGNGLGSREQSESGDESRWGAGISGVG